MDAPSVLGQAQGRSGQGLPRGRRKARTPTDCKGEFRPGKARTSQRTPSMPIRQPTRSLLAAGLEPMAPSVTA
ncbi:hypothetical protein VTN96DRAFT_3098 [Rasamsonia emersonii]